VSAKATAVTFSLTPTNNERLAGLCGQLGAHIKQIESYLGVQITNRGSVFSITGKLESAENAERVLQQLYRHTEGNTPLSAETVHRALRQSEHKEQKMMDDPSLLVDTPKRKVTGQNSRQHRYIKGILAYDVNFGVGPAGTGKTYLAVACAVQALIKEEVSRIVLVRPAVEAGERLGFLPGDIGQKVDPYLRPLYDALYEMLGFEKVARLIDRNIIELAPLAYMRGRTLNDSFVILDEAQNTTVEQMKMFLTRIGFRSKAVVTGDLTQTDLPRGAQLGLKHAIDVLKDISDIRVTIFEPRGVVRHPLVQKIVEAYESHDSTKTKDSGGDG
jgi:phosphate starvation-inducible PhoH-like protein